MKDYNFVFTVLIVLSAVLAIVGTVFLVAEVSYTMAVVMFSLSGLSLTALFVYWMYMVLDILSKK